VVEKEEEERVPRREEEKNYQGVLKQVENQENVPEKDVK
jgi:hypothetical protein